MLADFFIRVYVSYIVLGFHLFLCENIRFYDVE